MHLIRVLKVCVLRFITAQLDLQYYTVYNIIHMQNHSYACRSTCRYIQIIMLNFCSPVEVSDLACTRVPVTVRRVKKTKTGVFLYTYCVNVFVIHTVKISNPPENTRTTRTSVSMISGRGQRTKTSMSQDRFMIIIFVMHMQKCIYMVYTVCVGTNNPLCHFCFQMKSVSQPMPMCL